MISFKFSVKLFAFTWLLIKATLKPSDFDAEREEPLAKSLDETASRPSSQVFIR